MLCELPLAVTRGALFIGRLVVEGVEEIEEDGPEDGGGEENGGDFAARGKGEAPSGVRAVAFAEAVFEGGT